MERTFGKVTKIEEFFVGGGYKRKFGTVYPYNLGVIPKIGTDKYYIGKQEVLPIAYDEWLRPIFAEVVEGNVTVKFTVEETKVDVDSPEAIRKALKSVESLKEFFDRRKIYMIFGNMQLNKWVVDDKLYIDYDTIYFLKQDLVKTRKGGIIDADYWGNIIWGQSKIDCPKTLEEEVAFQYIKEQQEKKKKLKRTLEAFDSFE